MSDMTRYRPRSPGARLSALRRALDREDAARDAVRGLRLSAAYASSRSAAPSERQWADAAAEAHDAPAARMEAERELWEARAGHGLD